MSVLVIIMIQISEWIWQLVIQLFGHYAAILEQKNVNELGLYLVQAYHRVSAGDSPSLYEEVFYIEEQHGTVSLLSIVVFLEVAVNFIITMTVATILPLS